jgi:flagellar biosynthesis/type III secretory pathway M-ring protein FliF/YscJ
VAPASTSGGGAIHVRELAGSLAVENCRFDANRRVDGGGALDVWQSQLALSVTVRAGRVVFVLCFVFVMMIMMMMIMKMLLL